MIKITIRDFSRNMKEISERVALGESFRVTKNGKVIFEITPNIKEEEKSIPIVSQSRLEIIQRLQLQIQEKLQEISDLNQHINALLREEIE